MLINAVLQKLTGGRRGLPQAKMVEPSPQVIPVVKEEAEVQVHLEEAWEQQWEYRSLYF